MKNTQLQDSVTSEMQETENESPRKLKKIGKQEFISPGYMPALNGLEDVKAVLLKEIPRPEFHGGSVHYTGDLF